MHFTACLLSLQGVALISALPQVNQEIDTEEDLLAIDSFSNEVSVPVPILPSPSGFAGLGDRFIDGPQQPVSQAGGSDDVTALVYNNKINKDGSYAFNYETSDGQRRTEQGQVGVNGGYIQTGSWEYIGQDGQTYSVTFVADENGFRPVGHHIPTSPALVARHARFLPASKAERKAKRVFKRKTESKEVTLPRSGKFNRIEAQDNQFDGEETIADNVTKEINIISKVKIRDNSTSDRDLKGEDSVVELNLEELSVGTSKKNKLFIDRLRAHQRRNNQEKESSKKNQGNKNKSRKSKTKNVNKSTNKKYQNKGRSSRRGRRVRLKAGEGPVQKRKSGKT